MNCISKINSTTSHPAFQANYKVFQAKLKMKQLFGPIYTTNEKYVDRIQGRQLAETMTAGSDFSMKKAADLIQEMLRNKDYYTLEGFNKGLGKIAKEIYKLL